MLRSKVIMQQIERKPVSTGEITKKWNEFSAKYSRLMSNNFEGLGLHLFNMVGGNKADIILEAGCGDGTIGLALCLNKKAGARLICTDLVENMCKLAAARFEHLRNIIKTGKILGYKDEVGDLKESKTWNKYTGAKWEDLGVDLYQADNEDFKPLFPEGDAVDCYIANLSLHLVSNPTKMLEESLRVLKPGGKAIFTVWGNEEDSQYLSIPNRVAEILGVCTEKDPFYLKDRVHGIKRLEDTGFIDVLGWEMMIAYIPESQTDIEEQAKDFASKYFETNSEKHNQMVAMILEAKRKLKEERKFPIGLSVLILMGTKPAN